MSTCANCTLTELLASTRAMKWCSITLNGRSSSAPAMTTTSVAVSPSIPLMKVAASTTTRSSTEPTSLMKAAVPSSSSRRSGRCTRSRTMIWSTPMALSAKNMPTNPVA